MKVILSGGEKGTFRNVLTANGVQDIAMNLTQYNIPKTKAVDLGQLFKGADVYIYTSDGDEDSEKFDSFVREHADNITGVIGRPGYNGEWLGEKYIPLWNDEHDVERLAYLCQKYGRAAVSDRAINTKTLSRINQLQQRWGADLYGITSKVDHIESVEWTAVLVSSWTSVVRYGETQIWDGHGLRRYPAQKKESARKKHRGDIIRLGIDYEAIQEDDVSEVAKLAVKSWLAWDAHTSGNGAYHPILDDDEQEFGSDETGGIVTTPPLPISRPNRDSDHPAIATDTPLTRHEDDQLLLPVIGVERVAEKRSFTTPEGDETFDTTPNEVNVITHEGSGIRNCDSCYLASRCPAFKEHVECAYRIPVRIHTKQQLQAVLTAMLEMQTSRVLFARFAEELEGQGVDPAVSTEMDRLFKLVKDFKDIEDTRDLVRVEVEARGSAGVLSRIFGQKAADKANALPQPMETEDIDEFIINADLVDGEQG